jgi:valyl-tRNA synthetase
MMITATGQDVFLSNDKFEIGRNFGTKIWNAARFMQMQDPAGYRRDAAPIQADLLSADDRHILAKLNQAIETCTENLKRYRFNDAAQDLYAFIWHEYCDWYVEYSKDVLYGQNAARRAEVLKVMHYCFSTALRLLHPFMPHLTEELWHGMGYGSDDETIMLAPWPRTLAVDLAQWGATSEVVAYVDARHELIRIGRMLRADCSIAPGQKLDYIIKANTPQLAAQLKSDESTLVAMLKVRELTVDPAFAPTSAMPSALTPVGTLYMPIEGLVDVKAESAKLTKQLEEIGGHLERANMKLNNPNFFNKAKPEVVAQFEKSRQELQDKYNKVKRLLEMMS